MKSTLYLVRHGEASAGWAENPDPPLSKLGRQQAEQVKCLFASHLPLPIVSSPLLRALQTARPLADHWQVPVLVEDAFREIPAPPGMTLQQRLDWLKSVRGLTWREASESLLRWRENILQRLFEASGSRVIFTHFMVLNLVAGQANGDERLVHYQPDNGSVLTIEIEDHCIRMLDQGRQAQTRVL